MQKETALKIKLLSRLKKLPRAWILKTQEMARSGTPDIIMSLNGIFVAIELKSEKGVLSKLQEYNLNKISETGAIALVISPSNLDASINFIENMARKCSDLGHGKKERTDD